MKYVDIKESDEPLDLLSDLIMEAERENFADPVFAMGCWTLDCIRIKSDIDKTYQKDSQGDWRIRGFDVVFNKELPNGYVLILPRGHVNAFKEFNKQMVGELSQMAAKWIATKIKETL